eukprot:c36095_g1_i1 orf=86-304(+)
MHRGFCFNFIKYEEQNDCILPEFMIIFVCLDERIEVCESRISSYHPHEAATRPMEPTRLRWNMLDLDTTRGT